MKRLSLDEEVIDSLCNVKVSLGIKLRSKIN
jgi:hypothetical protein